ncbi:hypothetical protein H2199_001833 [Coniosporium tulheliwenetii]|uniref:Uncharacterized protein n=1 Tax=Coniosporium tulheliwenetii TaxID=3383036 RepID=A0ACC2ZKE0_9PEZI|nr:hypothetical protein H2199_001833 [Cladosporium sp. JES 115]
MASTQKTAVNVVFGAMTIGKPGVEQTRVHTFPATAALLNTFQSHGHNEIDTARFYGGGSSEEYLGELDWQSRGWVDMWYLHGPDRTTPFSETLREVDALYKEGYFKRFGISNYMSWEVSRIGVYNALHRAVEPELFACLRHYGIAFYAYNPLAGAYLTNRYHREDTADKVEAGSRFDPARWQGKMYRARYWTDGYFDALDILRPVAERHGLSEAECALRTRHLEENLVDMEKGPLPDEVLQALDAGWKRVREEAGRYWH